jgi:predicted oxidoreductase
VSGGATAYEAEVVIVGGGIAGLVTAYDLLEAGKTVLLFDKDTRENLGGLAKKSFGGVHMIGTPHQKKLGIRDDPDKAYADWSSFADFGEDDDLPRKWARYYCENSRELIFDFLDDKKIEFLPIVNWPERGMHRPGNSVPRWHIAWGTGFEIIDRLVQALEAHPRRSALTIHFEHEVNGLEREAGRVVGIHGRRLGDSEAFTARAERVVLASGGICGGDLSAVRANWYAPWGKPPELLLNGAHRYGDGLLHEVVRAEGGKITHLDKHWHYAAGVPNPKPEKPHDGLSLVPPRSALWFNALGERIMNPGPLVP